MLVARALAKFFFSAYRLAFDSDGLSSSADSLDICSTTSASSFSSGDGGILLAEVLLDKSEGPTVYEKINSVRLFFLTSMGRKE